MTVTTVVLLAFAAYNGWRWYQRNQAEEAAGVYAELERAMAARETERVGALSSTSDRQVRTHGLWPDGCVAGRSLVRGKRR